MNNPQPDKPRTIFVNGEPWPKKPKAQEVAVQPDSSEVEYSIRTIIQGVGDWRNSTTEGYRVGDDGFRGIEPRLAIAAIQKLLVEARREELKEIEELAWEPNSHNDRRMDKIELYVSNRLQELTDTSSEEE